MVDPNTPQNENDKAIPHTQEEALGFEERLDYEHDIPLLHHCALCRWALYSQSRKAMAKRE